MSAPVQQIKVGLSATTIPTSNATCNDIQLAYLKGELLHIS